MKSIGFAIVSAFLFTFALYFGVIECAPGFFISLTIGMIFAFITIFLAADFEERVEDLEEKIRRLEKPAKASPSSRLAAKERRSPKRLGDITCEEFKKFCSVRYESCHNCPFLDRYNRCKFKTFYADPEEKIDMGDPTIGLHDPSDKV